MLWLKLAVGALALLGLGISTVLVSLYQRVLRMETNQRHVAAELQDAVEHQVQLDDRAWLTLVRFQKVGDRLRYEVADVTGQASPWNSLPANGSAASGPTHADGDLPETGAIPIPTPDLQGPQSHVLMVNAWLRTSNNAQAKEGTLSPFTLVCAGPGPAEQRVALQAHFFQLNQLRASLSSTKTAANAASFVWRPGSGLRLEVDPRQLSYNLAEAAGTCDVLLRVAPILRLGK